MLDEYALVPDIFDPAAYTNNVLADAYLPFLKEPLFNEAIVRDIHNGAWSQYCLSNAANLHRLTKEIIRKLIQNNRLSRFPAQSSDIPAHAQDWCNESLRSHTVTPLTGIIASHSTKQTFAQAEVASIEMLTGTNWWQRRSPSVTVDRKTNTYLAVLDRVFHQANSLMFIDPNLDPSSRNYREFSRLLTPLSQRQLRPRIEIHRSLCQGDGRARTFPTEADWKVSFAGLGADLHACGLTAEVFLWDDFHERYLITDIVGVSVPAGFDVTGKKDDWSTWGRLGREDKDKIQRLFDPAARPESLKWHFQIGA
ncbi:hypothetical protein [Geotalea uraniireducens]|uniref:Uncharacterized protein n=1 Tax=Geotalea uraniireducens (strain Rf4) TaxID=351605 RepID=A5GB02_GEOUR|nr:hypothetical protein [Geotalea uraniireducens]ABQ25236.1 hypothetical protein Gura_1030 [Geotalea uraniireducens Rf4]